MTAPRFKRKLTPFLCREMLYDYICGDMDEERRAAVTACLAVDRETQEAHDAILSGLTAADSLSHAEPSDELLETLLRAESALSLGRRYSRWSNWPKALRWSGAAVALLAMVSLAVVLAPWRLLRGHQAQGPHGEPVNAVVLAPIANGSAARIGPDAETDEGDRKPIVPDEVQKAAQSQTVTETSGDEDEPQTPAPAAAAVAAAPPPKEAPEEAHVTKATSFVYRAWLSTANVEGATADVIAAIRELGGEKAGEVELGWHRGSGSYFHFTLPQKNEQELMDRLKALGRVRFSKDAHPRVMPPGQIRLILWVEADRSR